MPHNRPTTSQLPSLNELFNEFNISPGLQETINNEMVDRIINPPVIHDPIPRNATAEAIEARNRIVTRYRRMSQPQPAISDASQVIVGGSTYDISPDRPPRIKPVSLEKGVWPTRK